MKKYLTKENLFTLVFVIVTLHPFIELDYNFVLPFPRLTTVVDFVILPILVIITFFVVEKNKKKVLKFAIPYGIILGVYFVYHCLRSNDLQYKLFLPNNYVFVIADELFYFITLMLPLVYIWVFNLTNISEKIMEKIVLTLSCTISLPIFISNLFVFGKSTYQGYTIANFLSWFSLPFDNEFYHPRKYATKFFFEEGNTIGIIMFMILPFLYYFAYKNKDFRKKIAIYSLIVIQSLSMIILSTRVATYGAVLIPAAMLAIYIALIFFKYEKFNAKYVLVLLVIALLSGAIIPYGPAYQNQLLDAQDYGAIKHDDSQRKEATNLVRKGDSLEKGSKEWRDFYVFMFEEYQFLTNVTPPVYYLEWYDYRWDPEFWVDLIFDYELEERVSGRQLETIFTKYKWNDLSKVDQLTTGLGYGTFMRGGITIERDFTMQYYLLGLAGFMLTMVPWFVVIAYLGISLILGYKNKKWTYFNIITMMSICLGVGSSYVSGHVMDELSSSLIIAMLCGMLFKNLKKEINE